MAPAGSAGAFNGKTIYTLTSGVKQGTPKRFTIPRGSIRTDDATELFDATLVPFSLDAIVRATTSLMAQHEVSGENSRPGLVVPFLMRKLVTSAILRRSAADEAGRTDLATKWLLQAQRAQIDVQAAADRAVESTDVDGWEQLALRMFQDQARDQATLMDYMRDLWLARRIVDLSSSRGVDIDERYREEWGISHRELCRASIGSYSSVFGSPHRVPIFDPQRWDYGGLMELSADVRRAFFRLCARDYRHFRSISPEGPPQYETYWLSPLSYFPLVTMSDGNVAAPIPRDLLERPSRSFFIDTQQLFAERKRELDIIQNARGEVYENYVGQSLLATPGARIYRCDEVISGARKRADFLLVERGVCTIIEAKAGRIRLEADIMKHPFALTRELDRHGIGKGLAQIQETANAIRSGLTPVPRNSTLVGLLVHHGEQVHFNLDLMPKSVQLLAEAELRDEITINYQLVNDRGFDRLTGLAAARGSIGRFLVEKLRNHPRTDIEDEITAVGVDLQSPPLAHKFRETWRTLLPDALAERIRRDRVSRGAQPVAVPTQP